MRRRKRNDLVVRICHALRVILLLTVFIAATRRRKDDDDIFVVVVYPYVLYFFVSFIRRYVPTVFPINARVFTSFTSNGTPDRDYSSVRNALFLPARNKSAGIYR